MIHPLNMNHINNIQFSTRIVQVDRHDKLQHTNLLWESCTEHHCLTHSFGWHVRIGNQLLHVINEAEVKHTISFVKHQEFQGLDANFPHPDEEQKFSWSCNYNMTSLFLHKRKYHHYN